MDPNSQTAIADESQSGGDFQPAEVSNALDTVLNNKLRAIGKAPVINDSGNHHRITGIRRGFFTSEQLDGNGEVAQGGLHQLPVNAYYLDLVMQQIDWNIGMAQRSAAPGGSL